MKRSLDDGREPESKRLATELRGLSLKQSLGRNGGEETEAAAASGDYMDGVEGKHLAVVTPEDWLEHGNEVEIDPTYLQIPRSVMVPPDTPFYERPSQALILYNKGDDDEPGDEMDL